MKTLIASLVLALTVSAKPAPAQTCKTCSNDSTPAQTAILVHGRGDTPARWDSLVSYFTATGRGYVENTNLFRIDLAAYCGSNGFCSVLPGYSATYVNESYAKCLQAFINEKVPCTTTCPAVDIITHSQGGVMARYYTRFLAPTQSPPREVNDFVVMANPIGNGITNCTLAGSCTGVNPEDCPDSTFARKLNGVSPEGDGSNDETPSASQPNGPINYGSVVSSGDKTVVPWCTAYFIQNPQTQQGDDLSCSRSGNYSLDGDADQCKLSNVMHLVIPTNSTAIQHAYCTMNED